MLWWLLVPLTLAPQMLMQEQIVGPDTSDGLIPNPLVLGYYACFFFFGAFFFRRRFVMRRWWALALLLPALLLLVFPVAFVLLFPSEETAWAVPVSEVIQVAYAWLMCFGLIGLFRCDCLARAALGALRVGLVLLALSVAPAAGSLRPKARTHVARERASEVLADLCHCDRRSACNVSALRTLYAHRHDAHWEENSSSKKSGGSDGVVAGSSLDQPHDNWLMA